jgi:hypothetical protein
MASQRPKRQIKKPSRYSKSPPPILLDSQLPDISEVYRPRKRPLQVIPVGPIPEDLAASLQRSIPSYTPPLGYIEYRAGLGVCEALDQLSAFLPPFSEACVERIVTATNSYPAYDRTLTTARHFPHWPSSGSQLDNIPHRPLLVSTG